MARGRRQDRRMRYAPSERLLRLARHLAGTRTGLTLDEMAKELEVGRRLRDSLVSVFPQMECVEDAERVRRWRLPSAALVGVVQPRAESLAAIETAARECEVRGGADRAALLREALTTLRAVMWPDALHRAEYRRTDGSRGDRDAPRAAPRDRPWRAADLAARDPRHAACRDPLRRAEH